jgi:hypothetical protein
LLDAHAFLETFFAAPNEIAIAEVAAEGRARHLLPWVDRIRHEFPLPTVLPRRQAGRIHWYGLAFSERQFVALGEQLLAFVGPTYSTFRGHRATLDLGDPIDEAALAVSGGLVYKFTGPAEADNAKSIWTALELMRSVGDRRPERELDAPRATGRVLRDFYMALEAKNRPSAFQHLRYLSEHHRLTPNNVLFLKVQALAELGEWKEVLQSPELNDLLQMRRPIAVTEALVRAVYHEELGSFEAATDVDGALDQFRRRVLPSYAPLFIRRSGLRTPEAAKALMILAVAAEPPDPDLRDAVWNMRGIPEPDRIYLKLLADRLPSLPTVPASEQPLVAAVAARDRGDYDNAFEAALGAPPTPARARLLLECAYELQTLEAEGAALSAIGALSETERMLVLQGRRSRETYERLTDLASAREPDSQSKKPVEAKIPSNWIEWLEQAGERDEWSGGVEIARRGAAEWRVDDFLAQATAVQTLGDLLRSSGGGSTLQLALPHLLAFFQRDPLWPRPELVPLYTAMMDVLAIGTLGAEDDVRVFVRLAEAVLELGITAKTYAEIMLGGRHLLADYPAPNRVQFGIELLETAVTHPCPNEGQRLDLLLEVAALIQKFWRRVNAGQRTAFRLLCQELGQVALFDDIAVPAAPTDHTTRDVLSDLNGKSIAIYSLTERAANYMRQVLFERAPGAVVHLAHDKVASESLRNLARRADIFVMATASATHAATEFIQQNRPKDLPLLRPAGKGMTSMLQILEDFLRSGPFEDHAAVA